jgi:hypothetical protein
MGLKKKSVIKAYNILGPQEQLKMNGFALSFVFLLWIYPHLEQTTFSKA